MIERHYTIKEIAEATGFSDFTVRRLFRNEPGVLKLKGPGQYSGKRAYVTTTVSESAFNRVINRMNQPEEPAKAKRRPKTSRKTPNGSATTPALQPATV
jgi:hypothetical protein